MNIYNIQKGITLSGDIFHNYSKKKKKKKKTFTKKKKKKKKAFNFYEIKEKAKKTPEKAVTTESNNNISGNRERWAS